MNVSAKTVLIAAMACALGGLAPIERAWAQEALPLPELTGNDSTLVDRVVAVVGDSVITMTQILEELQVVAARGQTVAPEEILEELVNVQLVLQAAARDTTLQISEEEIDERVEAAVDEIRQRFGTELAYQTALESYGMTAQQYRDQLRTRIRTEQMRDMFIRKELQSTPPVSITEQEMMDFFEARRGSLQQRPELLTLQQIFVEPTASDSAWAEAKAEADSVVTLLVGGADFAELAAAHSDDPSADEGGDLGWFRRGVMVREFEQTAFQLADGQVSAPVRTRYGYHVIQVQKRRPGEVKARHILIRPAVSADDADRALARAEDLARRAREGESMDSLRAEFGDQELPGEIQIARDQLAQLPYPAAQALAGVSEGSVVGPLEAQLGAQSYRAVIRVQEIRAAGEFTFEDVRSQIRQQLSQTKRIERIYERLRNSTYVDIRM
jgi:peptidyl-prolyl cis-trans isomerase SurA